MNVTDMISATCTIITKSQINWNITTTAPTSFVFNFLFLSLNHFEAPNRLRQKLDNRFEHHPPYLMFIQTSKRNCLAQHGYGVHDVCFVLESFQTTFPEYSKVYVNKTQIQ